MYYVTDTHAFLWYLADSPRLSRKARAIFEACDMGSAIIVIPAIVLLETIDILEKKKVALDFHDVVSKILQADNFVFSPVDWPLILKVQKVRGELDLHDRVIIATAQIFAAPLISKDRNVKHCYEHIIW